MTDASMVERVAREISNHTFAHPMNGGDCEKWDEKTEETRSIYMDASCAAITAMRGYMTDLMVAAWAKASPPETVVGMSDEDANRAAALVDWNAMLDAALGEG